VSAVPIVVSKVIENLPGKVIHASFMLSLLTPLASQTGQVYVGDTIVEINGIPVEGKTHEEVVQMLKETSAPHVTLTLKHDSQMAPLLK